MVDLTRYKGPAVVGAGLLCAFVVLNVVLLAAFGREPGMFNDPDRRLGWTQLESMGAQVAGVERQMRRGGLDAQPAFGVVLGQSTALRGIDPALLESRTESPMPWLLLNGFGSSFAKLHYYAQTLLASELRPDTVVLCLHETMLAGQGEAGAADVTEAEPTRESPDQITGLRLRKKLREWVWVRAQRAAISHRVNMALFEARLSMHRALGSGAVGLFAPSETPWESRDWEPLGVSNEEQLRKQEAHWRAFGWFDPVTYSTDSRQAGAFRALIEGVDALGPERVVIVLMPETGVLRDKLPAEAMEAMGALIDEVSVGRPIEVLDLREAMSDEAFADYAHLTPLGREAFTRLLAERLDGLNTY